MKNFLAVSMFVILFVFGKEIFGAILINCPPLIILLIAVACISDGNCLEAVGGGCLFVVGIVALIVWLV